MASIILPSLAPEGASLAIKASLSAIGSYIDNTVLMPALFPPDPVEGAKIGEIGVMGADKGQPAVSVYGSYAKVAGQLLWAKKLQEVSVTEQIGKNGKRINYQYYVDCAVGIARTKDTALASIDSVLADEKVIYTSDDLQVLNDLSGTGMGIWEEEITVQTSGGKTYEYEYWLIFDTTINATVVTDVYNKLDVGDTVNISGFTNSENNDSADIVREKSSITITETKTISGAVYEHNYTYKAIKLDKAKVEEVNTASETVTFARVGQPHITTSDTATIVHGLSTSVTIQKVGGVGWADDVLRSGEPTVHLGNNASPDSVISAIEGSANTPAFKDMAYVVFNDLNLQDFGIRIPNFEFIASNTTQADARACIEDIMQDSELLASEYDVSAISQDEIIGYAVVGATETAKKIQPIMVAFNILGQERGGVVHLFSHSDSRPKTALEADYIGAYNEDKPSGGIAVSQLPVDERLGEVSVTYIDVENDNKFQQGLERAMAYSQSSVADRETSHRWTKMAVNLAISMTPDSAREIAHRLLWTSWANDLKFSFTLPSRYLALQENDRISFEVEGKTHTAMIDRIDLGANYMLKVEATLDVAIAQDFSEWGKT